MAVKVAVRGAAAFLVFAALAVAAPVSQPPAEALGGGWDRSDPDLPFELSGGLVGPNGEQVVCQRLGQLAVRVLVLDSTGAELYRTDTWSQIAPCRGPTLSGQRYDAVGGAWDPAGNLYLAVSSQERDVTAVLSFSPSGSLRWERVLGTRTMWRAAEVAVGGDGRPFVLNHRQACCGLNPRLSALALTTGEILLQRTERYTGGWIDQPLMPQDGALAVSSRTGITYVSYDDLSIIEQRSLFSDDGGSAGASWAPASSAVLFGRLSDADPCLFGLQRQSLGSEHWARQVEAPFDSCGAAYHVALPDGGALVFVQESDPSAGGGPTPSWALAVDATGSTTWSSMVDTDLGELDSLLTEALIGTEDGMAIAVQDTRVLCLPDDDITCDAARLVVIDGYTGAHHTELLRLDYPRQQELEGVSVLADGGLLGAFDVDDRPDFDDSPLDEYRLRAVDVGASGGDQRSSLRRSPGTPLPRTGGGDGDSTLDYAALGDSFASGEGLRSARGTSCGRATSGAYAQQLFSQRTDVGFSDGHFFFEACSGAEVSTTAANSIRSTQMQNLADHLDAASLDPSDLDLVTVSGGGNDLGFLTILRACITEVTLGSGCETDYGTTLSRDILRMRNVLYGFYDQIRDTYENATVLVVGYPMLVADPEVRTGCSYLSDTEIDFIRANTTALNQVIRQAAADAGVRYVDAASAFGPTDGGACSFEPKLNDWPHVVPPALYYGKGSFHPNQAGHDAYLEALQNSGALYLPLNPTPHRISSAGPLVLPRPIARAITSLTPTVAGCGTGEVLVLRATPACVYRIALAGLRVGAAVIAWLHSDPVVVGSASVGEDGVATVDVTLPPSTTGQHTLEVLSEDTEGGAVQALVPVQVASVPGAPASVSASAVPGATEAQVSWQPPASDGGAGIVDYEVAVDGNDPFTVDGATSTTITGLAVGEHSVEVRARNDIGQGSAGTTTFVVSAAPPGPTFLDVPPSHPFFDEIEWMADEGISTGFPDGTYRPQGTVSRAAMSAFMYRLAGEPPFTAPGASSFSDVAVGSTFFDEIEWMADEGVTTGFPDGRFKPGQAVSRAAMSAFMQRLAEGPGVPS